MTGTGSAGYRKAVLYEVLIEFILIAQTSCARDILFPRIRHLPPAARGKPCRVISNDLKVRQKKKKKHETESLTAYLPL